jgi:nucleotidyltransferase substrate binding protein (TIGR01987 family)
MEMIKLRYDILNQTLLRLDGALEIVERTRANQPEDYTIMRDGMIKRFEYSIDLFCTFLKVYLEDIQEVSMESASPKAILKLCWSLKIFNDVEYDILLKSASDYNLASHDYNEEVAEKVQEHIPLYYQTMKAVVDKLHVV